MTGNAQRIAATLILALLGWIVTEQRVVRNGVSDLCERMARLDGRVETLVEVLTDRETNR